LLSLLPAGGSKIGPDDLNPNTKMPDGKKYELKKTFAGLPRTTRGQPINLKGDPKGKSFTYVNGNSIFIRDVEDTAECDVYTQHAKETTVATFSPSGFYMASGDVSGKIRIWDLTQKEHLLKYEYQPISGKIKDIAWTEDSKRLAVCGEGREKYAAAFLWDTGSSVGNLNGPAKYCNSIDIKQNRPYRLCLASEDYSSYFYEGPPFKTKDWKTDHTNFVNVCRFSPDGSKYVTAGADGKAFIYDGKTGELIGELNEPSGRIHKGGVYGVAWSADSKKLMTCSADKTVKIWNLSERNYISNKEETVFEMGSAVEDMQVGCAWINDTLVSVSLSGHINFLDLENPKQPKKVIKGHNKAIIASSFNDDRTLLFTSSFDGSICCWNVATGDAEVISGDGHKSQVSAIHAKGNTLYTCGIDDTVRYVSIGEKKYENQCVKLPSQPQAIAAGNLGLVVVACLNEVVVIQDGKITNKYETGSENYAVAVNADLGKVCVGIDESKVLVYDIKGDSLEQCGSFSTNGRVTDIKFSGDNQYVAISTAKKQVKVIQTSDFKTEKDNWGFHSVKVNGVSWSPGSTHVASCGTDGHAFVYQLGKSHDPIEMRGAHAQSIDVTSIQFKDDSTLLTTGRQDCSIRVWNVTL